MTTTHAEPFDSPVWRVWLARATVALMPLSINIEHIILERYFGPQKRPLYVSPLDILLPLLVLLLIIDLVKDRARLRCKLPPLPALLWLGLAAVSCLWIESFPKNGTLGEWGFGVLNPMLVVVLPI